MATVAVPASFHSLPAEILLNIALSVPDPPSLYAFDRASTHLALIFNEYGSQILERVMCTTESDRAPPHQLYEVIRLVTHVRIMCLSNKPPQTLDAITGQLLERTPSAVVYNPIPLATPPSILREILATATTIAQLAPLCLVTHMRRCLALRPSHPVDRSAYKPGEFSGVRPAYINRPGYTYTPHSAGPPSWLEMERVQRALWTVQLYLEIVEVLRPDGSSSLVRMVMKC